MRAFIAVDIPDEIKRKISELQTELKTEDIFSGNWASGFHITLKFLGEVDEEKLKNVRNTLENICKKTKKFDLELKGLGAFPSEDYIRVVFAGAGEGDEPAMFLQKQVDAALRKENFAPASGYKNHVTLIRVKSVNNKSKLKEIFSKYREKSFGKFAVDKIKIVKSTLAPNGPVYETIYEIPFA